jgi:SAM-dependent methyltransferase
MAADIYADALEQLETLDRRLAMAAGVVETLHPDAPDVGRALLGYARQRYPTRDVVADFVKRATGLAALQERFDANPSRETLGSPDATIDRDSYNLALLLSIPFTNHRFETMQQLGAFVGGCSGAAGRIVSIGTGTGYELRLIAALPERWTVESYDIEETVKDDARDFLRRFGVARPIAWGREFPLDTPPPELHGRYDAMVLCELLEHLPDPARALQAVRRCLAPAGRAFVTMAVNIAQEDHVFLYPDLASCRAQIAGAGLKTLSEWITPQTTLPPPANRERLFRKGNYVAVVAA